MEKNNTIKEIIQNLVDIFFEVNPEASESLSKEEIENSVCKYVATTKKRVEKIQIDELKTEFVESYAKGSIFMIDAQLILDRLEGVKHEIKQAKSRSTSTKH